MNSIKILFCLFFLFYASASEAQDNFRNGLELNYSIGYSGVLSEIQFTSFSPSGSQLITESMTAVRAHKISGSFFRYFSNSIGVKFSIGISTNGFNFKGVNPDNQNMIIDTYTAKTAELGISFMGKIPAFNYGSFLIEPGVSLYADISPTIIVVRPSQNDSFVFSGYFGYEMPMFNHNVFANIGILINLPIKSHNYFNDGNMSYYPYFIGLRLGVNYQY